MFKKIVVEHFGSQSAVARALGVTRAYVSAWPERVPEKQALKLERLTKGQLTYDESLYQKDTAIAAA
ncbi:Cro/CI family transcriptional regulator [Marinomonas atlantica]|uniref:Cro/CI family transcriptional regulator n=1 Tax=Marinomonas atlantica TaxID=1806668 RepID=UPI00082B310D|nr:Cro/CI family transcriptional regulator [Marinomonas atlantica]